MTDGTAKDKERTSPKRRNSGETFAPSFTLDEYEVEEVSFGKAAKLLKKAKRRRSKPQSAARAGSKKTEPAKSVPQWDIPDSQDVRYEVEEIDPENLPSWMSDEIIKEQSSGKD